MGRLICGLLDLIYKNLEETTRANRVNMHITKLSDHILFTTKHVKLVVEIYKNEE